MLHTLDTDTASYIVKHRPPEIEAKLAGIPPSKVCVSAITRAELLHGLKRLPADRRLHVGVRQLLRIVRVLPWDEAAAHFYAEIHQLVTRGQPIGELDMMIAAHSLATGAALVTNKTSHFHRIDAPLILLNWIAS